MSVKAALALLLLASATALAQTPDAPPTAPPAAEGQSTDGIDLAALGLDPSAPAFDDKLEIFGFADFEWYAERFSVPIIANPRTFSVGKLNIYLSKNLSPRWRTLIETRLLFAPNGSLGADGMTLTRATASDATDNEREIPWGGISIERAYVEYDVARWLTLRAGHFLTPYGIWNTDHGSPAIIGTQRPYIIGEQFFPEHQTGIELFGKKAVDEYEVEYHATVSNGRNPYEATRDPDRRLAFGGRILVTAPWSGTLRAGVSAYRGRASETMTTTDTGPSYDETALGTDVGWNHGGFHAQAEMLVQQRRYLDGRRAAAGAGFLPDGHAFGAYALAGYRTSSLWNVMPYVIGEYYAPFDPSLVGKRADAARAGLNFRPLASVVLKAEWLHVWFEGSGILKGTGDVLSTQAAWVF